MLKLKNSMLETLIAGDFVPFCDSPQTWESPSEIVERFQRAATRLDGAFYITAITGPRTRLLEGLPL